ncbi:ORF153 [Staphylococcus phage 187]|uniref:ORF153 n=1 Tax=Staphylococcus phage 187 TaxID=2908096 RepID=Q4ZE18_9CAUD|nr:ORF153 [Staphylococcus phage 187]AAX90754.1 ORF153 [Staphylococcus phage 187]
MGTASAYSSCNVIKSNVKDVFNELSTVLIILLRKNSLSLILPSIIAGAS